MAKETEDYLAENNLTWQEIHVGSLALTHIVATLLDFTGISVHQGWVTGHSFSRFEKYLIGIDPYNHSLIVPQYSEDDSAAILLLNRVFATWSMGRSPDGHYQGIGTTGDKLATYFDESEEPETFAVTACKLCIKHLEDLRGRN